MIIASAIKLSSGRVFVGKRHGDVVENIHFILKDTSDDCFNDCITGFINDNLQFLNRAQAYYEAFEAGQCKEQKKKKEFDALFKNSGLPKIDWEPCLASEDLW